MALRWNLKTSILLKDPVERNNLFSSRVRDSSPHLTWHVLYCNVYCMYSSLPHLRRRAGWGTGRWRWTCRRWSWRPRTTPPCTAPPRPPPATAPCRVSFCHYLLSASLVTFVILSSVWLSEDSAGFIRIKVRNVQNMSSIMMSIVFNLIILFNTWMMECNLTCDELLSNTLIFNAKKYRWVLAHNMEREREAFILLKD